jgi:hypothetical protein
LNLDVAADGRPAERGGLGWGLHQFFRELIEASLAHVVGNTVERAYRRSDAFAKRRRLMEAWAGYCSRVVLLDRKAA